MSGAHCRTRTDDRLVAHITAIVFVAMINHLPGMRAALILIKTEAAIDLRHEKLSDAPRGTASLKVEPSGFPNF